MFQRRIKVPEKSSGTAVDGATMLREPEEDEEEVREPARIIFVRVASQILIPTLQSDTKNIPLQRPTSPDGIVQSEPAENDAIPQEQPKNIDDEERINALFALKEQKLEEESAARLVSANENDALRIENERLQIELKKMAEVRNLSLHRSRRFVYYHAII
jgi:hypothetical protein